MDFADTTEEAGFRQEARSFLEQHAPALAGRAGTEESESDFLARAKAWQKLKQENGWACLNWPKAFGGRGATPMEMIVWNQEEARYNVPTQPFAIGLGMCGPVVMGFAGDEQQAAYLPKMASGEDIWCQLFSEPAGGSDVANLRTRAVQDGDEWVINGQKIWTSGAQYCDYGILLTRTDPSVPKHQGLTMFIVNMKAPGVEIRPIKQASGKSGFNEVYFTDVRIKDDHRLGAVGDGWKVSIVTLMNERLAVGSASGPDAKEMLALAQTLEVDDRPALENKAVRDRIATWHCEQSGLHFTKLRVQSAMSRGETPGPENSITKI
ncbi:MAG: acyl-CoA dehydrogenase family protein, partial [Pseudomonadales bacterium]